MTDYTSIVNKVSDTLLRAASTMTADHKLAPGNRTSLQNPPGLLSPLCDDTGIPHLVLVVGANQSDSGSLIDSVYEGVHQALLSLRAAYCYC